jgi:hypothetical protein
MALAAAETYHWTEMTVFYSEQANIQAVSMLLSVALGKIMKEREHDLLPDLITAASFINPYLLHGDSVWACPGGGSAYQNIFGQLYFLN